MKNRISELCCLLLLAACSPDLMDTNSVAENNQQQIQMHVDVRVTGSMVSTRSAATQDECAVGSYSLYVFDVATDALQYYEQGITPDEAQQIAGTKDYRIGSREISLETSGQKQVFALANTGDDTVLPTLVTAAEATNDIAATKVADFRQAVAQHLAEGSLPTAPLTMSGATFIASSADATVPVCLGRTVAKIAVLNAQTDRIALSEVAVTGVSAEARPLATTLPNDIPTTDYAPFTQLATSEEALSFYLFPGKASQTVITVKGTLDGTEFTSEAPITDPLYADYDYALSLRSQNGKIVATFSSDFSGANEVAPIELSGEWLSDKAAVTLPFTPEPNYGFTINYLLNVDGTAVIERTGEEKWFDAEITGEGTIRIRTLQENLGEDRTATFAISVGGATCPITVTQQGLLGIKTVTFGKLEWMDRALGATLRSSQAFANDVHSFGYLYQWGRTMPFPATGAVEVVTSQMTPTEAVASKQFIAYTGESQDWNSQGIEGTTDSYWETVSQNPCPAGWRLPTYEELADVMGYRNNSLIFASGQQKTAEYLPNGVTRAYNGYGSGAITAAADAMYHFGIKYFGTADAYYIRYQWLNTGGVMTKVPSSYSETHASDTQNYMSGGENILRIDRIPTDASAKYASQAAAKSFWADHETDAAMQSLVFPCGGRRDASGALVESHNAAFFWSRSMFTGAPNTYSKTATTYASGLLYFRPAGRYMFLYAPVIGTAQVHANTEDLGYRNQAMQLRCVKEK